MENIGIYALGFLGQALFGARLTIQWWQSEKLGRVVSPIIYWYLSLAGSLIFLFYGVIRSDIVIILGQIVSYFIYIRNLQLKNVWSTIPFFLRILIVLLPAFALGTFYFQPFRYQENSMTLLHPLMLLGIIGQLALNLRFVYQWYYSEKSGSSVLPFGFWSISTWASVLVIAYASFHPIYGFDPVLFVSQTMGIVVYIRNMILLRKQESLGKT